MDLKKEGKKRKKVVKKNKKIDKENTKKKSKNTSKAKDNKNRSKNKKRNIITKKSSEKLESRSKTKKNKSKSKSRNKKSKSKSKSKSREKNSESSSNKKSRSKKESISKLKPKKKKSKKKTIFNSIHNFCQSFNIEETFRYKELLKNADNILIIKEKEKYIKKNKINEYFLLSLNEILINKKELPINPISTILFNLKKYYFCDLFKNKIYETPFISFKNNFCQHKELNDVKILELENINLFGSEKILERLDKEITQKIIDFYDVYFDILYNDDELLVGFSLGGNLLLKNFVYLDKCIFPIEIYSHVHIFFKNEDYKSSLYKLSKFIFMDLEFLNYDKNQNIYKGFYIENINKNNDKLFFSYNYILNNKEKMKKIIERAILQKKSIYSLVYIFIEDTNNNNLNFCQVKREYFFYIEDYNNKEKFYLNEHSLKSFCQTVFLKEFILKKYLSFFEIDNNIFESIPYKIYLEKQAQSLLDPFLKQDIIIILEQSFYLLLYKNTEKELFSLKDFYTLFNNPFISIYSLRNFLDKTYLTLFQYLQQNRLCFYDTSKKFIIELSKILYLLPEIIKDHFFYNIFFKNFDELRINFEKNIETPELFDNIFNWVGTIFELLDMIIESNLHYIFFANKNFFDFAFNSLKINSPGFDQYKYYLLEKIYLFSIESRKINISKITGNLKTNFSLTKGMDQENIEKLIFLFYFQKKGVLSTFEKIYQDIFFEPKRKFPFLIIMNKFIKENIILSIKNEKYFDFYNKLITKNNKYEIKKIQYFELNNTSCLFHQLFIDEENYIIGSKYLLKYLNIKKILQLKNLIEDLKLKLKEWSLFKVKQIITIKPTEIYNYNELENKLNYYNLNLNIFFSDMELENSIEIYTEILLNFISNLDMDQKKSPMKFGLTYFDNNQKIYFGIKNINEEGVKEEMKDILRKTIVNNEKFNIFYFFNNKKIIINLDLNAFLIGENGILSFQSVFEFEKQNNFFFDKRDAIFYQTIFKYNKKIYLDSLKKEINRQNIKNNPFLKLKLISLENIIREKKTKIDKIFFIQKKTKGYFQIILNSINFTELFNTFILNNIQNCDMSNFLFLKKLLDELESLCKDLLYNIDIFVGKGMFVRIFNFFETINLLFSKIGKKFSKYQIALQILLGIKNIKMWIKGIEFYSVIMFETNLKE